MINVPYASLMGVMTADGKERTTLATFRFIFAFGGSFLVLGLFQPLFDGLGTTTISSFATEKAIEIKDTTATTSTNKLFVWDGKVEGVTVQKVTDSALFLTAKVITKSQDAFQIGLLNSQTNEKCLVTLPAGKDTLGLLRDGTSCNVQIKLNYLTSNEKLTDLSNFKFAYVGKSADDVKFHKVAVKEIDYKAGTQKAVMIIALIAVLFFFLTFSWTRERIKPISEKTSLKDDVKDLMKNSPWFILLGAGVSTIFFNTIRDGAAIYYFKYYFQGQGEIEFNSFSMTLAISTVYLLIGQAANIVGVVLAKPASDKFGKKNTFLAAMIIATVLSLAFYWLDRTNITSILIFQALISISAGIIFPLVWSMYADTADYSEWKNGRRATGLVFSAASMSQKFGASIGIALAGWLLALYGYQANVAQTAEAQQGIRMMLSIYPAIGAILAALFMFIYPLKESFLTKIEGELQALRATKGIKEE